MTRLLRILEHNRRSPCKPDVYLRKHDDLWGVSAAVEAWAREFADECRELDAVNRDASGGLL